MNWRDSEAQQGSVCNLMRTDEYYVHMENQRLDKHGYFSGLSA